jgi:phosphatidylglycerophosphate synthase
VYIPPVLKWRKEIKDVAEVNAQVSLVVQPESGPRVHSANAGGVGDIPAILMVWTLGRLLLIPMILVGFVLSPSLCAMALIAFIGADIYDGVLARGLNADGVGRRVLDSLIDRASVWTVLVILSVMGYLNPVLLGLLMARDVYCAWWCYRMLRRQRVAIKADWLHRCLNLAIAAWVISATMTSDLQRSVTFVLVLIFSIFVAVDLRSCVRRVLEDPRTSWGKVVPARSLRAR